MVDDLPVFLRLMGQRQTGTSAARTVRGLLSGAGSVETEAVTVRAPARVQGVYIA